MVASRKIQKSNEFEKVNKTINLNCVNSIGKISSEPLQNLISLMFQLGAYINSPFHELSKSDDSLLFYKKAAETFIE